MPAPVRRCTFPALLVASIAVACSSSPAGRTPRRDTPDAEVRTDGGDGSGGAAPSTGGAVGKGTGGAGGASTGGATASGGTTTMPDASAGGDASVGGEASVGEDAGAGEDASTGDAGGGFGTPTTVTTFGCFSVSGDGNDLLASGEPATIVTNSPHSGPCGGSQWISDNANAYSPQTPPTTIALRRSFVLDPSLSTGDVTVSLKADDAAEVVLNGQSIATCTPPVGNAGFCQQACRTTTFPSDVLLRDNAVNNVEIRLVNLQSAAAGGGNFGWTAISYTLCIQPPG